MFNLIGFNRSPFNRTGEAETIIWRGSADAVSTAGATANVHSELTIRGDAVATAVAEQLTSTPMDGSAAAVAGASVDWVRKRYFGLAANAVATAVITGLYVIGEDVLDLSSIEIPGGSELVIDTDRMTVTIDSRNAIYALSDDSTFFNLSNGDIITISGTGTASVALLWKDRWL